MKKITIITGHYGSGKTNLAVNLALRLADAGERSPLSISISSTPISERRILRSCFRNTA